MRQLKAIKKRWEYWFETINGYKLCFRRNMQIKDFYVEATDCLALAMGYESLSAMLGNNLKVLDAIYGDNRKWFLIEWIDEKPNRIQMGLRIDSGSMYCVLAEK